MNFSKKNHELKTENKTSVSKILKILFLTLFVSASVFAQRPNREKIQTLKIAHITEQLDLSKDEAQNFWPVYNAYEKSENKLRARFNKMGKDGQTEALTESEAKVLLLNMVKLDKERVELRSKKLDDLLKVLPAKKIVKLVQTEKSFKRKMLQEFKSRHAGKERKN